MTTKPARCCVLTQRGTRCANEPSPVRPVRMIGPVRLAACGLEAHQRALWSLPGFVRHDAYCGAFGCDRPSNAGICPKHRDQYRDFGITEHMLLAQEAPMTEPAPMPPAAPQEAADGGATPEAPILWDDARWALYYSRDSGFAPALWFSISKEEREAYMRVAMEGMTKAGATLPAIHGELDPGIAAAVDLLRAEGLSTTDSGDGYSKKEAIEAGEALDYAHVFVQVDQGFSAAEVAHIARKIPWTDYGYQHPMVEVMERAPESAADEPEIVGVIWDSGELRIQSPAVDAVEPSVGDVDDALDSYPGGFATSPPAFGPTPGPTVADLQAELKEATRLSECRRKEVQRRGDALARVEALLKDAEAQLNAITDALDDDPERSPAWDGDGNPIPLPRRVEIALMPDPVYERELRKSLHAVEAELFEVDRALQHLGAYGNGPTKERLLQVLTPEDRRAILEVDAAEARMDLARLKARRLNPSPPEKLAEYAAKVAEVEAKLAALDAGDVRG